MWDLPIWMPGMSYLWQQGRRPGVLHCTGRRWPAGGRLRWRVPPAVALRGAAGGSARPPPVQPLRAAAPPPSQRPPPPPSGWSALLAAKRSILKTHVGFNLCMSTCTKWRHISVNLLVLHPGWRRTMQQSPAIQPSKANLAFLKRYGQSVGLI